MYLLTICWRFFHYFPYLVHWPSRCSRTRIDLFTTFLGFSRACSIGSRSLSNPNYWTHIIPQRTPMIRAYWILADEAFNTLLRPFAAKILAANPLKIEFAVISRECLFTISNPRTKYCNHTKVQYVLRWHNDICKHKLHHIPQIAYFSQFRILQFCPTNVKYFSAI